MATIHLLEKARQRRLIALASLGSGKASRDHDRIVSIFDGVFDVPAELSGPMARNNVIAFRTARAHLVAGTETAAPERIAA